MTREKKKYPTKEIKFQKKKNPTKNKQKKRKTKTQGGFLKEKASL